MTIKYNIHEELITINKFIERIDEVASTLHKQKNFLEVATLHPIALFESAHEFIGSSNSTIFNIMNIYENDTRRMNVHEFQNFLRSIISQYFDEAFNDPRIEVRVRNINNFPSIFSVWFDGGEIIQFSILRKYYGKRGMNTKNDIENRYAERKREHEKSIEDLNKKMSKCQKAKDNPFKYTISFHKNRNGKLLGKLFRGLQDIFQMTFQRKMMFNAIDGVLEKYKKEIAYRVTEFEKYNNLKSELDILNIQEVGISIVEPIFIKHNYRLETEASALY